MPIYEYRCESCGHALETMQSLSEPPLLECPKCAKPSLKKLISAAGFRLKGGGWYETDFKQNKRKNLTEDTKTDAAAKDNTAKDTTSKAKDTAAPSAGAPAPTTTKPAE